MKKTTMTTLVVLFIDSLLAISPVIFTLMQKINLPEEIWSVIRDMAIGFMIAMIISAILLFNENLEKGLFIIWTALASMVTAITIALGLSFTISKEIIIAVYVICAIILILTIVFNIAIEVEKKDNR